jgi:hypothetical protein
MARRREGPTIGRHNDSMALSSRMYVTAIASSVPLGLGGARVAWKL